MTKVVGAGSPEGGVFKTRSYRPLAVDRSPFAKAAFAALRTSTRLVATAGAVGAATGDAGPGEAPAAALGEATLTVVVGFAVAFVVGGPTAGVGVADAGA